MTKTHRKILQMRLKLSTAPQSCVTFPWKFITVKRLIGEWIADVYSVHFADVLSVYFQHLFAILRQFSWQGISPWISIYNGNQYSITILSSLPGRIGCIETNVYIAVTWLDNLVDPNVVQSGVAAQTFLYYFWRIKNVVKFFNVLTRILV